VAFVGVLVGLAVAAAAAFARRLGRPVALVVAAASVAVASLLAANVFGEDGYVSNGASRWATRGGNAHALFVVEVVLAAAVAGGFILLAFRRRAAVPLAPLLSFTAVLEAFGAWAVLIAFNAN
jgi:hypothetical protein